MKPRISYILFGLFISLILLMNIVSAETSADCKFNTNCNFKTVSLDTASSLQEKTSYDSGSAVTTTDTDTIQDTNIDIYLLGFVRDESLGLTSAHIMVFNKSSEEKIDLFAKTGDKLAIFGYNLEITDLKNIERGSEIDFILSKQTLETATSEEQSTYNFKNIDLDTNSLMQETNDGSLITRDRVTVQLTPLNIKLVGFERDESNVPTKAKIDVLDIFSREEMNLTVSKGDKLAIFDYSLDIIDIRGGLASSALEFVISKQTENTVTYTDCTDSDGGKNIYVKGTTSSDGGNLEDVCSTTKKVMEFFCQYDQNEQRNRATNQWIDCPPNSICEDGRCLEPCNGCLIESGNCVALGYRIDQQFCSNNQTMDSQKETDISCTDNYECLSNLCVDNNCINASLWQKFIAWLSGLFY